MVQKRSRISDTFEDENLTETKQCEEGYHLSHVLPSVIPSCKHSAIGNSSAAHPVRNPRACATSVKTCVLGNYGVFGIYLRHALAVPGRSLIMCNIRAVFLFTEDGLLHGERKTQNESYVSAELQTGATKQAAAVCNSVTVNKRYSICEAVCLQ